MIDFSQFDSLISIEFSYCFVLIGKSFKSQYVILPLFDINATTNFCESCILLFQSHIINKRHPCEAYELNLLSCVLLIHHISCIGKFMASSMVLNSPILTLPLLKIGFGQYASLLFFCPFIWLLSIISLILQQL